jgi:holo-[acyl-carrier protein] synthase
MIIGVGIDLQVIAKLTESLAIRAFIQKVFTPAEIALCENHRFPDQRFAGKFAIKEAFMKAIGSGIRQGVWFAQIEVLNRESGAPYVQLYRDAAQITKHLGAESIHVTLSHSAGIAVGVVILESQDGRGVKGDNLP